MKILNNHIRNDFSSLFYTNAFYSHVFPTKRITKTKLMSVFINLSHCLQIMKLHILNGFPDLARTSSKFREALML